MKPLTDLFPCSNMSAEANVYALRETLFRVLEALDLPHHVAGGAWQYLMARYTEPHRRYHTLGHLVYMFNAAAEIGWLESLKVEEVLAILYHDVIYEIGAKDNEEASAAVLTDFYNPIRQAYGSILCDEPQHDLEELVLVDAARSIIRDTALYMEDKLDPSKKPSYRVLDLDLAIFAAPRHLFDMSNQLVRQEFGLTAEKHILFHKQMLEQRSQIFRTEEAFNMWEDAAQTNMRTYVEAVEQDDEDE